MIDPGLWHACGTTSRRACPFEVRTVQTGSRKIICCVVGEILREFGSRYVPFTTRIAKLTSGSATGKEIHEAQTCLQ